MLSQAVIYIIQFRSVGHFIHIHMMEKKHLNLEILKIPVMIQDTYWLLIGIPSCVFLVILNKLYNAQWIGTTEVIMELSS